MQFSTNECQNDETNINEFTWLDTLYSTEETCVCVNIVYFTDYFACSSSSSRDILIHNTYTYTYKHAKCPSIIISYVHTERKYENMILSFTQNKQR